MADHHKHKTSVQEGATAPTGTHVHTKEPEVGRAISQRLGEIFGGVKLKPSRNTLIFLGVVAAAVILYFVWRYFASLHADHNAEVWFRWERTADPDASALARFARDDKGLDRDRLARAELDQLETFAKENKGTIQGKMARFQIARALLFQGLRDLGSSEVRTDDPTPQRNAALAKIKNAAVEYKSLADESGDLPLLAQEALLNGGKAWETLGEYEKARECYTNLTTAYPKSRLYADAEKGLDRLKKINSDDGLKKMLSGFDKEIPK
jgi:tetratricopeptide (TPR) repeat protein